MRKTILGYARRLPAPVKNVLRKMYQPFSKAQALHEMNASQISSQAILQRYAGQPIPDLGYATVKDFCDSADHLSQIMRLDGDLKDVQRAWTVKAVLGRVPVGGNLLEIGGGEPLVANLLQGLGYNVTVIDPYDGAGNGPQLYEHFKRSYPKLKFIRAYFEKDHPALEGQTFDCIFSISVLEHIPHEKLPGVFAGIHQYLSAGGQSIHCIDHVIAGLTEAWNRKGILEMLCGQWRILHPETAESEVRRVVEATYDGLRGQILTDVETYFHSALGHKLWLKGLGLPYEEFPFRKVVSLQTCVQAGYQGQLISHPVNRLRFDEAAYLATNPPIKIAVMNRQFASGLTHYIAHGYKEKRAGVYPIFNQMISPLFPTDDPLPAPPPILRARVHGVENLDSFNIVGKIVAINIETTLQETQIRLEPDTRILDFGCGCGRVLKWFQKFHPESLFYGTDIDQEAIAWCRENISSIGEFLPNRDVPPLPFPDEQFDFVYVISIFTHLPEDMQFLWLSELKRVTKRNGHLFISIHGENLLPANLIAEKKQLNSNGFYYLVGKGTQGLPDFYQNSYHTQDYIYKQWSRYFEIRQIIAKGINNHQDLVICRKTR